MPNYRYHTQESDRRNCCCGHSQNMAQRSSCPQSSQHPSCSCSSSVTPAPSESKPASTTSCAVGYKTDSLKDLAIAMAYVPWQTWRNIYDPEKALCRGTLFQDLDQPFCGAGGVRK